MFGGSYFGGSGLISKKYLLYDTFMTDRAAGSVNGTPAEPGPGGNRVVTDTTSILDVTNGQIRCATAAIGGGNPGLWYASQARVLGKIFLGTCIWDANAVSLGFDASQSGTLEFSLRFINGVGLTVVDNGTAIISGANSSVGVSYDCAFVMRSTGLFYFVRGGVYGSNWLLVGISSLGSSALFPGIEGIGATSKFRGDNIRIPSRLFIPAPLASDSFAGGAGSMDGRLTDGLGHAEANGGSGRIWTAPTWTVDGAGAAVNTPTQGADVIVNGAFAADTDWTKGTGWTIAAGVAVGTIVPTNSLLEQAVGIVGIWYQSQFDIITRTAGFINPWYGGYTGQAQSTVGTFTGIGRAESTTSLALRGNSNFSGTCDNVSFKAITFSTLFSSLVLSTVNVMGECVIKTLVTDTQAGFVARLDNAANPTKGIIGYWDGKGNVKLDEFTTATTWTNLLNVVKAYATGDKLVPWLNGSAWRLYHITAAGVATLLGSGTTTVLTGNLCGCFNTYSGNAIESCVVSAVGTEGQYEALNQF